MCGVSWKPIAKALGDVTLLCGCLNVNSFVKLKANPPKKLGNVLFLITLPVIAREY